MLKNGEIYTWFGLPIYEAKVFIEPTVQDGMLKYCEKYYKTNKHLTASNGALTGDTHGMVTNVCNKIDEFYCLTKQIGVHVKCYLEQLGVDTSKIKLSIMKSWPVCCDSGSYIKRHTHIGSHLSVVYYVQNEINNETGKLRFHRGADFLKNLPIQGVMVNETSLTNSNVDYNSDNDTMLIFPSSIEHEVLEYRGSSVRYSVSADVIITANSDISNVESVCADPSTWVTIHLD